MTAKDRLVLHDSANKTMEEAAKAANGSRPFFKVKPTQGRHCHTIKLEWLDQPYYAWSLDDLVVDEEVLWQLRDILNELFPADMCSVSGEVQCVSNT